MGGTFAGDEEEGGHPVPPESSRLSELPRIAVWNKEQAGDKTFRGSGDVGTPGTTTCVGGCLEKVKTLREPRLPVLETTL